MSASIVITTAPTLESANALASLILNHQLGACIQVIGPIQSHYIWKDTYEKSTEYQLQIKTLVTHYKALEALITENHPYDCPEIIQIPITTVNIPYLNWITQSTKSI